MVLTPSHLVSAIPTCKLYYALLRKPIRRQMHSGSYENHSTLIEDSDDFAVL